MTYIKQTYSRLDSLLRPLPAEDHDDGSLGSSDLQSLIESWVWNRPTAGSDQDVDSRQPEWCELAILTGDGRHLLGEGKSILSFSNLP